MLTKENKLADQKKTKAKSAAKASGKAKAMKTVKKAADTKTPAKDLDGRPSLPSAKPNDDRSLIAAAMVPFDDSPIYIWELE